MNFELSVQINTWEIYVWFLQDFKLTRNSDHPYLDQAGPTCMFTPGLEWTRCHVKLPHYFEGAQCKSGKKQNKTREVASCRDLFLSRAAALASERVFFESCCHFCRRRRRPSLAVSQNSYLTREFDLARLRRWYAPLFSKSAFTPPVV